MVRTPGRPMQEGSLETAVAWTAMSEGQAPQVPGNSVAEFVEELKTFLPENTQSLGWCTACFALDLGPRAETVALTGHLVCLMNASWRTFTSSLWCFAFELQPC